MAAGADGTLLVGPPFANPIWRELVDSRDEGTPVWNPVYDDGDEVLFVQDAAELRSPTGSHDVPNVMYLQNSSDPVVWWNPQLLYRAPEWHVYGSGVADAWAALLQPPDWTTEDTLRLRARLDTR
jgi:uncharacterized membrane protein